MVATKWQPGDPSASLLLTSEKAVFCKNDNDQKFNIYWSWWNPQIRNELCPCAHRHVRGILVHGQKRTQDDWLSSREPPLWLHGQSPNIFLASHITHAVPTLCVMVDFAPINELPKSFVEVLNCIALVSVREGGEVSLKWIGFKVCWGSQEGAGNSICRRKLFAHGCEKSNRGGKVGPRLRRAKVSPWIGFWERTMGELEWLWWEGGTAIELVRWREDCGWVCTTSTARSSPLRTQQGASLALHIQDIALYNNSACYSHLSTTLWILHELHSTM